METGEKIALAGVIIAVISLVAFVIHPMLYNSPQVPPAPSTPTPTPTRTQTPPVISPPLPSQTPTITETPEQTPSPIPTETPIPTQTPKPTDGIDQPPTIDDWGIMETYFDISDETLGKAEYTDALGRVYEYDSINFIVEAKRSFYAIIIFEAEFYDEEWIKVYSYPLQIRG